MSFSSKKKEKKESLSLLLDEQRLFFSYQNHYKYIPPLLLSLRGTSLSTFHYLFFFNRPNSGFSLKKSQFSLSLKSSEMEVSVLITGTILFIILVTITWAWRVVNWVWLRPKRLEKCLKQQGLKGTPYRLLFGDLKESYKMIKEARSKPINLSDDIATRLFPFVLQTVRNYGIISFIYIINYLQFAYIYIYIQKYHLFFKFLRDVSSVVSVICRLRMYDSVFNGPNSVWLAINYLLACYTVHIPRVTYAYALAYIYCRASLG